MFLLIGVAFIGSDWSKQTPLAALPQSTVQAATFGAGQTSVEPSASPSSATSQPEVEAASLKREAVAAARQVAVAYPNDALAYALLGSAYYNIGQSDEATQHLKKCLQLNPDQADAYEILARMAYERGEPEESTRLGQEALRSGPANLDVLNRLGRAQLDLGRAEEAVRTLQQAVRFPRPTSESCYLLGQAYMQSGDFAQAKAIFLRAITLMPDHTQAHFGLYTACLRLGQAEEAERYREEFRKLEATDRRDLTDRSTREDTLTGLPLVRKTVARTLFGAAQIHRVHQQAVKSAELFRRSAVLDAENPLYRAALEAFYVQRKALDEGLKVFQQLAAEQPENGLNHYFLGRLQGRLDQIEAAERSFQIVQKLAPEWVEGYRALAELYLRANRKPAEALLLARRVVELDRSGASYYLLAVACLRNQDHPGALEAGKQAVASSPGEKTYQTFLQQLQQTR